MSHKDLAIRALQAAKGDDLLRARHAFKGFTPEQMEEQHGQSGKTRREILNEYQAHADKHDSAIAWLKGVQS
jgi:hypothetical protein